jgi:MFS family permease
MQPAEPAPADAAIPPAARERSWLFSLLIAPDAVIAIGLVDGGLSYLLRDEGVNPARAASIVALLSLPHAIYFLWGPVTDFFIRRRTWLLLAATLAALTLLLAFHEPRLSSTRGIALLFIAACIGVVVPAACGGMMGDLRSEVSRRRAGSFYQVGSLTFGAVATFLLVVSLDRKCFGASPRSSTLFGRWCPEAFSIRRLEGRRWQWRTLLWS